MKAGGPLARRTPLTGDPATHRAWQQRSAQAAATRAREAPRPQPVRRPVDAAPPTRKPRRPARNDSGWRADVLAVRGSTCRVLLREGARYDGPCEGDVEIDHVHPRGQCGRSDVENGTPLCRRHHQRRTDNRLRYTRAMLDADQVAYLRDVGWVWWDASTGDVYGRGRKHFVPEPGPDAVPQP